MWLVLLYLYTHEAQNKARTFPAQCSVQTTFFCAASDKFKIIFNCVNVINIILDGCLLQGKEKELIVIICRKNSHLFQGIYTELSWPKSWNTFLANAFQIFLAIMCNYILYLYPTQDLTIPVLYLALAVQFYIYWFQFHYLIYGQNWYSIKNIRPNF